LIIEIIDGLDLSPVTHFNIAPVKQIVLPGGNLLDATGASTEPAWPQI
jgi:hypothetical protein